MLENYIVNIYYNDHNDITDEGKESMGKKYVPKNLFIKNQRLIEEKINHGRKMLLLRQ